MFGFNFGRWIRSIAPGCRGVGRRESRTTVRRLLLEILENRLNPSPTISGLPTSVTDIALAAPTVLASSISVTDSEIIEHADVKIAVNYQQGEDSLSYDPAMLPSGVTTTGFDATTGDLNFTGPASAADYQSLLQTVTYADGAANPNVCFLQRSVTFTVVDDLFSSDTEGMSVNVVANQTITFGSLSPVTYGVQPITLGATADSGLAVSYSIDPSSTGAGSINSNQLTVTGAGTIVIDANQPGNADYLAAPQVQQDLIVNRAALTITALDQTQPYGFGGTSAALGNSGFTSAGLQNGETVGTVTLTTDATISNSASYNSDAYNSNQPWTLTPSAATGGTFNPNNYQITYANAPTGLTITPKALTYSGLSVPASKTYDGSANAVVSGSASLQGPEAPGAGSSGDGMPYSGDVVSLTGTPTASYNTKDVATANLVTFGGLTLAGADSGDYTLTASTQGATITPLAVSLSGGRAYDGTTTAAAGILAIANAISPDTVDVASGSATLAAKDVGPETIASVGSLALGNNSAGDYTLIGASGSVTITPKALTYSGLSVPASKIYDGTVIAVVGGSASLQNTEAPGAGNSSDGMPYSGDVVGIIGTPTASYNSKDVASANVVTFAGLSLTGPDSGDYSLTPLTQAATITPKALTTIGLSVPASKTYDGGTSAVVSGAASLQGAEAPGTGSAGDGTPYSGDVVSIIGTPTASYDSKDVATASLVTFAGLSLTGADNGDYTLTPATQATTIIPLAVTLTGMRIYDGTTTASAAILTITNAVSPDTVDVASGSATLAAKDVASESITDFSGLTLGNNGAGDYTLTGASGFVSITPKALTYSGLSVPASKTYDGTVAAVVSGTASLQTAEAPGAGSTGDGVPYSGDVVSIIGTPTASYNSKDVATADLVTFAGLTLTGGDSNDYTLTASTQAASITPKALTYSGLSVPASKTYDGTVAAVVSGTASLQTAEAPGTGNTGDGVPYTGDAVHIIGTPTASYNSKDVATADLVTFAGLTLTGGDSGDYTLTASTQAASITPKALTASGLSVPASKTYDGTVAAVVNGSASLQNAESPGTGSTGDGIPYSGDVVSIIGTPTASYNSKDVASANLVTFAGLSLTGADNSDYTLASDTQAATIAPKALTYSGLSVPASKTYDGTVAAVVSGTASLQSTEAPGAGSTGDGVPYSGDVVSIIGTPTASYNSKDVATADLVTFAGLTLTGGDSNDYTLTASTQAASITPKALTYSGLSVPASKTYDGTVNAVVSGAASLQNPEAAGAGSTSDGIPYSGDVVNLIGTPTGSYNSKDVATANLVTFAGLSLAGGDSGDYTLTASTQAATITPKALTAGGLSVPASKIYDGIVAAVVNGTASLQNAEAPGAGSTGDGIPYSGDVVSIIGTPTASYNSKDVASADLVTFAGLSLTGADNSDYTLASDTQAAIITPKALTYSGLSVPVSKTYDGTLAAVVSGAASLQSTESPGAGSTGDGVPYSGDVVSIIGTPTASYNSKDVATADLVTFAGLTLTGGDSNDYTLTASTQAASITPKALTYSGLSVPASKTYDGTVAAVVSGTGSLQTAEAPGAGSTSDGVPYSGDVVHITGTPTASYNSKDVLAANLVTFAGLSLAGGDNGDYTLTASTQAAAITPLAVILSASRGYDGTTKANANILTITNAINPDTVDVASGDATLAGKDVGSESITNFSGLILGNDGAGDYTLTGASGSVTVTPKALTVIGLSVPASKTYDGTVAAVISGAASLQSAEAAGTGSAGDGTPYSGDTVGVIGTPSATYNTKDVATANLVSFAGLSLSGADSNDYTLTPFTQAATITPLAVTLTGSRIYDGTTGAAAGILTITNAISPDTVNIASGSAILAAKDIGSQAIANVSGLTLGNNSAGDYTLIGASGSVTIDPKTLYVTGLWAFNKPYDGTTAATLTGTASLLAAEGPGAGSPTDGMPYAGDIVNLASTAASAFTGTFTSPNVGTGIVVQVTGNSLAGDQADDYVLATPDEANGAVTTSITPAYQSITFSPLAPITYGTNSVALSATASSGLPVSFTVLSGPGADANNGSNLTITGAGNILIEATQTGNGNYSAAMAVEQYQIVNQAADTIPAFTYSTTNPVTYSAGLTVTLTDAGGGSSNQVAYTVLSGPGSVNGSILTVTGAGSILMEATQAGDANYATATPLLQTLTVNQASQTITFGTPNAVTYGVAPIALSTFGASASSGLPIVYSVLSGPGYISGGTLTVTGAGSIVIAADQPGNADYSAASEVQQTLAVNKASQTISFVPLNAVIYGIGPVTLSATASSGLPVAFSVVSGPGSLSGNTLTVTGAGSIVIEADQAGDTDFSGASPVQQMLAVAPAPLTVIAANQTKAFDNTNSTDPALTYTYTGLVNGDASASFTGSLSRAGGEAVYSYAIGEGTLAAVGNYVIANFEPGTFTITPASQTITFNTPASVAYGIAPFSIASDATASSGLPISYTIVSGPGSLNGNLLTVTGAGAIVIAADQPGNTDYSAAAQVLQTLTVNQASQTITFGTPNAVVYGAAPIALSTFGASATSGLPIVYSVVSGPGYISGGMLTVTGAGSIVIAADQPGDADYSAASEVQQTLAVGQASQTISFAPLSAVTYGANPIALSASAGSGLPVAFSVISGPGSLSGDILTVTGAGSIVIEADQAGNADFSAAPAVQRTLAVDMASQSISFPALNAATYGVDPITLNATASSGLSVAFSVVSGPGSVSGNVLTVTGAGSIVIEADQAGNADFSGASAVQQTLSVAPAPLTVIAANQTKAFDNTGATDPALTYTYTGLVNGDSSASFTGSLSRAGGEAVSSYAIGEGTLAAVGNYAIASFVPGTFTITPASQTITFNPPASVAYGVAPFSIASDATASSGLPISYTIVSGPGSLNGSLLTVTGAGAIVIAADQAGSPSFSPAAEVLQTLTVNQESQAITFGTPSFVVYGVAPITLSTFGASASSGLPITYSVVSGPGYISGGTLTVTGAGSIVIAADQPGNADYSAAAEVQRTLTVNPASLTVTANNASKLFTQSDPTFTYSYTGLVNGDLAATFTGTLSRSNAGTNAAGVYPGVIVEGTLAATGNYTIGTFDAGDFTINPNTPTLTFAPLASSVTYSAGMTINLSATSNSPAAVSFTILGGGTGSGTIGATSTNGNTTSATLTVTTAGTLIVQASQVANANWTAAAPLQQTVVVTQAADTISFPALPVEPLSATPISLNATGGGSSSPVVYTVLSGPGHVSGNQLTVTALGTVLVEATQAGDANFLAAAPVFQSVKVETAQAITFTQPTTPVTYSAAPIALTATANSKLPVSFSIVGGTGMGTISGSKLTVTSAGSFIIQASQAGNATYAPAAPIQHTLVVNKANQTITFAALTPVTYGHAPLTLAATANSGLAISYRVVSGPGTLNGNQLTITGAGSIVIQATQAGNANFNTAIAVSQTLIVNQATLTVAATNTTWTHGVSGQHLAGFTITGFVNGDTQSSLFGSEAAVVSCTTVNQANPAVGTYTIVITQGTLATQANYKLSLKSGTLTVH